MTYKQGLERATNYLRDGLSGSISPSFDGENLHIAGSAEFHSTVFGINLLRQNPKELFDWAKSDASGFEAAKNGIAEALEQGETLPKEAVSWLIEFLRDELPQPDKRSRSRGMKWKHFLICEAIRMLELEGMIASRNDATPDFSACDVVADALTALGESDASYDGVKKIWNRYRNKEHMLLIPR